MKDENLKEDIEFVQKHLKDFRRLMNVTSNELADYLEVTRQTISNIENGRVKMNKIMFLAIKNYFKENGFNEAEELLKYIKK